jgi:NAD(P)-dependent dehydrogenase (short-subunit alcohol dehydrogenase family)
MRLENKVAIVTGGGGSIGREIALELAREGAIVTVVDLDQAKAEATLKMIKALGGKGKALRNLNQ